MGSLIKNARRRRKRTNKGFDEEISKKIEANKHTEPNKVKAKKSCAAFDFLFLFPNSMIKYKIGIDVNSKKK